MFLDKRPPEICKNSSVWQLIFYIENFYSNKYNWLDWINFIKVTASGHLNKCIDFKKLYKLKDNYQLT